MTSLSDFLIQKVGSENIPKNSKMGEIKKRRGVSNSPDFNRIKALPRRRWQDAQDLQKLIAGLNRLLKTPEGTMTLWPQQAAALRDMHDIGGAFLPIGVGGGKALISLLAPILLMAKKPLLLVPAALREQTKRRVIPELGKHWQLHDKLAIHSYTEISMERNKDLLYRLSPDCIIMDECHMLKNKKSGRTKRVKRYMDDRPETKVVAMSGTVTKRSIKDYAHIIEWALKPELCPLPLSWHELTDWADAIDEGIEEYARMAPGYLSEFCDVGENVRQGFGRRLVETPGVVATEKGDVDCSLLIHKQMPKLSKEARSMLVAMRSTWTTPNGDVISEPTELWRHVRELSLGFFYEWDPKPPREWMEARKEWKKYVRDTLKHNRRELDTELMVFNECRRMKTPPSVWSDWVKVKDTFQINTVPRWVCDKALDQATAWLKHARGICWVEHTAFGERLAQYSGFPYYGSGPKAAARLLEAQGPIICSIRAHGTGKNLQHYSDNLIVSPPSSGQIMEQLLGRTHRAGQKEDEVNVTLWLHEPELMGSFEKCLDDAVYLEQTIGGKQKLNLADITFEVERDET